MNEVHLAVQCNGLIKGSLLQCAQWTGMKTTNLHKANKKCMRCGKTLTPRNKFGWNLTHKMPNKDQTLEELVQDLNYKEGKKHE